MRAYVVKTKGSIVMRKSKPSANEIKLSDTLSESFSDIENAVNESAQELQKIDDDIKALIAKIKSLNFMGMQNVSVVHMSANETLAYDFVKKDFFYTEAEHEGRKLLTLPTKTKKQIYEYYLPELLTKIADDFKVYRSEIA